MNTRENQVFNLLLIKLQKKKQNEKGAYGLSPD